jgi:hypothetical protein
MKDILRPEFAEAKNFAGNLTPTSRSAVLAGMGYRPNNEQRYLTDLSTTNLDVEENTEDARWPKEETTVGKT